MATANSDKLTYHEVNFVLALVCLICVIGIIITLEVVTIVDRYRLYDFLIQQHELKRQQELYDMAAARCFKAAELQGLDFVKVCPDWVY